MASLIIVAHRGGAKGKFKENTLEAFSYAIQHGFRCVEMDIRLDHLRKRFYLEHDLLHLPKVKENIFEKVISTFPKSVTLFTELKTYTLTRTFYARTFLELIEKYNLQKRVVVISFNPFVLRQIKKVAPELKVGLLYGIEMIYRLTKSYCINKIKPHYLIFSKRIVNRKKIDFARQQGYKIFTYVANKEKDWLQAQKLELDGIITDYPEKAADFFKNLKK